MLKKIFSVVVILISLLSLTNLAISQVVKKSEPVVQEKETPNDLYNKLELFSFALSTIQSEYVDEKSSKDLIYGSLKGMLNSLDPHSQFMDPNDYKELKSETKGKFGGLGIEISIKDSLLTVITPIEDTPAWKAGIKSGDRIVKIEKELTRDMTLDEAVKRLRGEPGTVLHITILRENEGLIKEFTITREIIHVIDVKDVHIIDGHIGYIRLTEFREDSSKEFRKALDKLSGLGMDSLIVDLRNNPGGLLTVAIKISEEFLPQGKTIVTTKGRHASQDVVALSNNKNGPYLKIPVLVMINEGSASASEIVAGALKDNKRGITLGTKSFGKGSVQSVIPMPDGSGLRLTTAKYFTPSGVCIHGIGITPDVVIERVYPKDDKDETKKDKDKKEVEKVFEDVKNKDTGAEMTEDQKKEAALKKKDADDNQLQSAINVIKAINVYQQFSDVKK